VVSFLTYPANTVYLVFATLEGKVGIFNSSHVAVVAKWEDEGVARSKSQIRQMIACQNGEYAIATEAGVEFF